MFVVCGWVGAERKKRKDLFAELWSMHAVEAIEMRRDKVTKKK